MNHDDRRLIEDYLPIEAISAEASREKSVRKGHISTLHLWWARRPLVACRAAVYGALVPADRWVKDVELKNPPADPEKAERFKNGAKRGLNRRAAAELVTRLCKYPGDPKVIAQAQRHILEAHAERLTRETGTPVTVEDIEAGRAPRPKVLDMFAGGGAIPLEALRLGCEAYALDLNPVAHIIQLCTLVYPQKYGQPDPTARGMTGPRNEQGETTWGGLAEEVRYWGQWVLKKVKAEIGDLYPLIPDPACKGKPPQPGKAVPPKYETGKGGTGFPACASSQEPELVITRRNLPHWTLQGSTYFITFRTKKGKLTDKERDIVLNALKHFENHRYHTIAAVVMPDHVHWLLRPAVGEDGKDISLSAILQGLKGFSSREINKARGTKRTIWLDENYDRIMRDEEEVLEKWHYTRNNPVKDELAATPEDYPWLWEPGLPKEEAQPRKAVPPTSLFPDDEPGETGFPARADEIPPGYLVPVAYLWTRTVTCKNPTCKATVPLVRQTWLCKKKDRYVALKMVASPPHPNPSPTGRGARGEGPPPVRFEVVEATTEKGLGFDPAGFSKAGNATCPFCGTVADNAYVKAEGKAGRIGTQPMAVVCTRPGARGKVYLSADEYPDALPDDDAIRRRIAELCQRTGLSVPSEPIINDAKNANFCILYGLEQFANLFTPRQMLCLLSFTAAVREAYQTMLAQAFQPEQAQPGKAVPPMDKERAKAVGTYLGCLADKITTRSNVLCPWDNKKLLTVQCFGRQALPMLWDFAESNPLAHASGAFTEAIEGVTKAIEPCIESQRESLVLRGSATALPWPDASIDAVVTDPPYYDNVPYADISDFFYVWLKRTIGHLYPEHFSSPLTPKKQEAVADATRHGGDKQKAVRAYEEIMAQSLAEAYRVLKPGGILAVVYAHKTTLGWSTLVDALRKAGFTITEAWPLDTEGYRLRALNSAALASSIFLVGRKRAAINGGTGFPAGAAQPGKAVPPLVGNYETDVQPDLEAIVRERVETLWDQGISGADLVIACVGAGLQAFTRYERVEYANGEEVPAARFLAEVEGVVLDTILGRLSKEAGAGGGRYSLAGVDPATRFYVLWRYTYRFAELDAGEAIVFANGTHVELDGPNGLSAGVRALIEKKKSKYRLRDFTERGDDEKFGMPDDSQAGKPVPLIDALHRTLWLMENRPYELAEFLREAQPNREQMRLVAQALAGPALKGGQLAQVSPTAEQEALAKLTSNWKAVIEDNVFTAAEQADRKRGQRRIF